MKMEASGLPVVGTACRLVERKNLGSLLELYAQAKKQVELGPLIIIGDGPQRSVLEERAKELGLEDSLQITGYLTGEQFFEKFKKIDIFGSTAKVTL